MEITRTARPEHFELKLNGRMDAAWSDSVAAALAECVRAGHHTIAVDMAAVAYLSSAGIRILVLYAKQLRNIQGRLQVINASGSVRKVLELAGLASLMQGLAGPGPTPTAAPGESARRVALAPPGATAEVFALAPGAALRLHRPGDAAAWLAGCGRLETCTLVEFPAPVMGLGLGAFSAAAADEAGSLGEFLAAAGSAVCQPADGSNKPDYMLLQGALTPTLRVAYGLLGRGSFAQLLRFDKGDTESSLPLSAVVGACLEAVGSDAVGVVMVAETAALIGASLQQPPVADAAAGPAGGIFAFPGIRDWLSFTAEAAFANTTSLVVGFAARPACSASLGLLRPLVRSGELHGHFHAAAFPYHPLRKGRVELAETLAPLFESEQVLGVLHLLHDWRAANGAGESRFLRGACWCAPLIR
jgi:anti-anti-sigma factor